MQEVEETGSQTSDDVDTSLDNLHPEVIEYISMEDGGPAVEREEGEKERREQEAVCEKSDTLKKVD